VHELSLSSAIVNTVVKHAQSRRVTLVSLRVGRLRQVIPDTLEFYFEFVARDTVCEGARLDQQVIDPRLRCAECWQEWEIEIPAFRCPECGGADVAVVQGDEFEVESIEVEEAECIAQR
jgi:hydrogenase nickel incorporation protein HypA/HybF